MFAHIAVRPAATGSQGHRPLSARLCAGAMLILMGGALAGCSSAPAKDLASGPADTSASVPATAYRNVTRGYTSQRPADAQPWQEMNRRVAPQRKGETP